ncbi:MAG TPA: ribosome maturation factor RimM [Candidatus Rubrimentiphilum sp.]|nr:ribosome maturation factor RimM [Candidatus Rubrimentiphilum sp.]
MNDELSVGRIAGVFGVRGELKCDPTSAGRMLFSPGEMLRAELRDGDSQTLTLQSVREHQGRLLLHFEHFDSVEDAETLKGATLYAARDRITLQPGEYLDADLAGCEVYDRDHSIGTVERVEHYPASDMLLVRGRMIPLIDAFVKQIDVANKRIDTELPEGLLE